MPICRYFVQGKCKYGDQCQFTHPGMNQQQKPTSGFGGESGNAPMFSNVVYRPNQASSPGQPNHRAEFAQQRQPPNQPQRFVSHQNQQGRNFQEQKQYKSQPTQSDSRQEIRPEDVIYHDLVEVKMQWPLGCYGLNLTWESGDNIIHGDFSPEELRWEAYNQMKTVGNIDGYRATLAQMLQERHRVTLDLSSNLSKAIALARTPRGSRHNFTSGHGQIASIPQCVPHTVPTQAPNIGLQTNLTNQPQQPPAPVISQLPTFNSKDFDAFTFGDIPELPPS